MSFSINMAKWADKLGDKMEVATRKVVIDLSSKVIQRTPVADPESWLRPVASYVGGRARANWQLSQGGMSSVSLLNKDEDGDDTIAKLTTIASSIGVGETIYLYNNLAYIQRLEDGWSKQAPAGMVAISVREFNDMFEKAWGSS